MIGQETIVLAGPPGVGKSTVARALGARRGTAAIDLDDAIAVRAKRPVPEIIRQDGEAAFRAIEAETLAALPEHHRIIALGGGTLTTPRGRSAARARGRVFGLSAGARTLNERLQQSGGDRPLLSDPTRLSALLAEREKSYAAVDRTVDAEGEVEQVVDRVVEASDPLSLLFADFGADRTRVLIGADLASACAGAVAAIAPTRPVLLISDRGVPSAKRRAYREAIGAWFEVVEVEVEGGENIKSWSFLGELLERALAAGCGRQSVVVGLGGGATCDLAALAASLIGRGAPVVLVPSTLLAQVDASIGGKAAVNMSAGRNLAGAFHPATEVFADVALLESLDAGELTSGLAELAKIALIADAKLFTEVASRGRAAPLPEHVGRAIALKADIVRRDPYERGERKLLNLGHTLGHALESASDFSWRHGEAVAVGIAAVCRLSAERGWVGVEESETIVHALEGLGLPTAAPEDLLRRSAAYLRADKKADAFGVDLIAIHGLGKVSIKRLSSNELIDLVRCGGGNS